MRKLTTRSDSPPKIEIETATPVENQEPSPTSTDKGKGKESDKSAIEETCNTLIAKGGKASALKAWEEAVGLFGEALENMYVGFFLLPA
jgi:hypothetical protein